MDSRLFKAVVERLDMHLMLGKFDDEELGEEFVKYYELLFVLRDGGLLSDEQFTHLFSFWFKDVPINAVQAYFK